MKLSALQHLYNEGKFSECLFSLEIFLLINPGNADAWLLRGLCITENLYGLNFTDQTVSVTDVRPAFDCFQKVLSLEPNNRVALLKNLELGSYFFPALEYGVFMNMAAQLTMPPASLDNIELVLHYKAIICESYGRFDEAVNTLQELMACQKVLYREDRSARDIALTNSIIRKTNILRHRTKMPAAALQLFRQYLSVMVSDAPFVFADIAQFALQHGDYDLAGKAALKATLLPIEGEEQQQVIFDLHNRIQPLLYKNPSHDFVEFMLLAESVIQHLLNYDPLERLYHAKQWIKKYPRWFVPYHFAGTAILDGGNCAEALTYFEKAMRYGGYPSTLFRYIKCFFQQYHQLPVIDRWPKGAPVEYYNAAVFFAAFENEITCPSLNKSLLTLRLGFYCNAYRALWQYLERNEYDSDIFTSPHLFIMCGNKYAMALDRNNEREEASTILSQIGRINNF